MSGLISSNENTRGFKSSLLLGLDKSHTTKRSNLNEQSQGILTNGENNQEARGYKRFFEDVIGAMQRMIEARDAYTAGHQERVSRICTDIAHTIGLSEHQTKGIQLAAMIHDIGKLSIPSEILSKPGQLNAAELNLIRTHSMVGYNIIKDVEFPWPIARMVLQHHERLNGSGYPDGLSGDEILFESRILSIADVIEAMSANRPYRPSLGIHQAIEEICKNKYTLYDGDIVEACLKIYSTDGFKV
jgi:HD-GYP domain-containing protein (c-di-GMP phosphodiesterase class II)